MMQGARAWGRGLAGLGLALCLSPVIALAQDDEPVPRFYIGGLGGYVFPDSARDAEGGYNWQAVAGVAFAEALAIELTGFGSRTDRTTDSTKHDTYRGGGLNLTLGTPVPGNPFFLLGGGAIEQDIYSEVVRNGYGELGLGLYLPLSFFGELWRLEGRYHVVFNDHPALADEDLLDDGRVNFGVLFTFGAQDTDGDDDEAPPVLGAGTTIPPDDADGDGVADDRDQCPDTPRWARAGPDGCIPDADRDGVDDARDDCPETAAGTQVDAHGCVPQPAPALAPAMPVDEDRDGINDGADACPNTARRLDVDERGCIKPEDVTLGAVHFDLESSRLTGHGYKLLRQVAAALMAQPDLRLEVGGHADASGQNNFNAKLSLERAEVVRDFLTYLGIAEDRFTVKGYGETRPLADNKTDEGRATNRRVEFRRLD